MEVLQSSDARSKAFSVIKGLLFAICLACFVAAMLRSYTLLNEHQRLSSLRVAQHYLEGWKTEAKNSISTLKENYASELSVASQGVKKSSGDIEEFRSLALKEQKAKIRLQRLNEELLQLLRESNVTIPDHILDLEGEVDEDLN